MAKGFAADVEDFTLRFIDGAEDTVRATAIELWSAIIKATPVDSGRARASWFATGKEASVKTTNNTDTSKDGSNTAEAATRAVVGLKDWSIFHLSNNLPYIEKLEFGQYGDGPKTTGGYSRQAPRGMVRISISRFNKILEGKAKESLPK